jgi:hypothetical protein
MDHYFAFLATRNTKSDPMPIPKTNALKESKFPGCRHGKEIIIPSIEYNAAAARYCVSVARGRLDSHQALARRPISKKPGQQ